VQQRVRQSAAVLVSLLVLTGCATGGSGAPTPTPTPSSSSASAGWSSASPGESTGGSASPSRSPSPDAAASTPVIPESCETVVDPQTYASTFEGTPLNSPGVVGQEGGEYFIPTGRVDPVAPAEGATPGQVVANQTQLRCIWRDPRADISGLTVEIATVDPAIAALYLASLPADGFECTSVEGGERCQRVRQDEQYPVGVGDTVFLRDSVVITVWQANFPTDNLLGSLVSTVWS